MLLLFLAIASTIVAVVVGNNYTESKTVVIESFAANRWMYVIDEGGGDDPYSVKIFPDKQTLVNHQLTYPAFSPVRFAFIILAVAWIIFFAVSHIEGDDHWEFRNYWCEVVSNRVKLYNDNGTFVYVIDGRLLCKSDHAIDLSNMARHISRYLRSPNLYEKCASVSEERERKISQLIP